MEVRNAMECKTLDQFRGWRFCELALSLYSFTVSYDLSIVATASLSSSWSIPLLLLMSICVLSDAELDSLAVEDFRTALARMNTRWVSSTSALESRRNTMREWESFVIGDAALQLLTAASNLLSKFLNVSIDPRGAFSNA